MHVFFEDDGQLKAGTVLADNTTSLQVEAASGKRLKIKAALASVERKLRENEQMASWEADLREHRLPDALRAKLPMLLYKPDKNTLEWKALAAVCDALRTNPVALLAQCGAIPSSHDYH